MSQQFRRHIPPELYSKHFSTINFKSTFGNCVHKALCNRKWKQVQKQSTNWNLQWCQKQRINDVFIAGVSANQKVNHFRLYTQLCRKDMLMKNIRKHKRQLAKQKKLVEKQWNFLPLTFFLPSQYIMFSQQFKRQGGIWIMKPTARCQGSGIFLVDKLSQVAPYRFKKPLNNSQSQQTSTNTNSKQNNQPPKPIINQSKSRNPKVSKHQNQPQISQQLEQEQQISDKQQQQQKQKQNENWIIQQYIDKPLLFGKKKFDLRIYVLCTNYSQLTVWLYRSGFARFTHQPYNTENIFNLQSHLTNVEIQKHSENYDEIRGGKWLLDKFKHYLISVYGMKRADECFYEIQNIIVRSLEAVQKHIIVSKNSFELYGYDLMIDSNLKPWLIQVNGGPSMTANTEFDCKLKCGLVDDVLTIVNFQGILNGDEMTVGGFDLIVNKGVNVMKSSFSDTQTNLGWKNDRKHNYKHLLKQFLLRKKLEKQQKQGGINMNEQKQNPKNIISEDYPGSKKQKLLPNFYYKQRPLEQIDESIRSFLKKQLRHLQQKNENLISMAFEQGEQQNIETQQELYALYMKKYEVNKQRFIPIKAGY